LAVLVNASLLESENILHGKILAINARDFRHFHNLPQAAD
jgi:hypothetical protein